MFQALKDWYSRNETTIKHPLITFVLWLEFNTGIGTDLYGWLLDWREKHDLCHICGKPADEWCVNGHRFCDACDSHYYYDENLCTACEKQITPEERAQDEAGEILHGSEFEYEGEILKAATRPLDGNELDDLDDPERDHVAEIAETQTFNFTDCEGRLRYFRTTEERDSAQRKHDDALSVAGETSRDHAFTEETLG